MRKRYIGYNISSTDLMLAPEWLDVKDNEDERNKFLWNVGFDTSEGIEVLFCEHRNRRNVLVEADIYLGVERSDSLWLNSGYASLDNRLAHMDKELSKDLQGMSKEGHSGEFEKMARKYKSSQIIVEEEE